MCEKYKPVIISYIAAIILFLIAVIAAVINILGADMIFSDSLRYVKSYESIAAICSAGALAAAVMLAAALVFSHKNINRRAGLTAFLIFLIAAAVVCCAAVGANEYHKTSAQRLTDLDSSLPETYSNLEYFKDADITFEIRTAGNSDADTTAAVLQADGKELAYYEIDTKKQILIYIFEMNLMGMNSENQPIAADFKDSAADLQNRTAGLDYYIYETADSYVYQQGNSHSQKEIYAAAKKTDGYSITDFENDILKLCRA